MKILKHFEHAFDEIRISKYFKGILGYILTIGNILNAGTPKGQAEGFYLDALTKTTTLKDVNNNSMLSFICLKMKEDDSDFVNFKEEFKNTFHVSKYVLSDEETKVRDVESQYRRAKTNFDTVISLLKGKNEDTFIKKIRQFME